MTGKMEEKSGAASAITGYKIEATTACGAVVAAGVDKAIVNGESTCCDPEKYTVALGVVPNYVKFILIKAVTSAGKVSAGVKVAVVDAGAPSAGLADAACTAGAGAAAFAALAVAALA